MPPSSADETNFFSITFKDDLVENTPQNQRCVFEMPELKNTTTSGILQYSPHLQGVYILWPHRNPILNTPPTTITDTILDAPACQLEIFNKFVKYLQKKILMKICILNHLKLSYMPDKLVFASDNAEIFYLEISKRIKANAIYTILNLYLQTTQIEFKIKPNMTEQYFSQFFINRTAPTTILGGTCIPTTIIQDSQQQQKNEQTEAVCRIINLADEKTPVIPPPPQQILTKQNIIDDITMTALIKNTPLPINDFEKTPPPPAKRLRLDSDTSNSTEESYSQIDSCSEANESSAESDNEKATPSEINLNNHFSRTLQTNSANSELSFSSIGSSILRKFKSMHINTNQYTQPLLMYINRSDASVKRDHIQRLFDKFVSEFPTTTAAAGENYLASANFIEQSRIELVEKLTSDNNLLQHIFLQATNGCIENIYQLFIIVLYTDILSSVK